MLGFRGLLSLNLPQPSVLSALSAVNFHDASGVSAPGYSCTLRKRNAFAITETELRLIAAPAMMGLSNKPKNG